MDDLTALVARPSSNIKVSMFDYVRDAREADKEAIKLLAQAIEVRFVEDKERTRLVASGLEERFALVSKSTDIARESMEKWFESVNEFRNLLKDQAGSFVTG